MKKILIAITMSWMVMAFGTFTANAVEPIYDCTQVFKKLERERYGREGEFAINTPTGILYATGDDNDRILTHVEGAVMVFPENDFDQRQHKYEMVGCPMINRAEVLRYQAALAIEKEAEAEYKLETTRKLKLENDLLEAKLKREKQAPVASNNKVSMAVERK